MHRVVGDSLRPSTCSGNSPRRQAVLGFKLPEELPRSSSASNAQIMRRDMLAATLARGTPIHQDWDDGANSADLEAYAEKQQAAMAQMMMQQVAVRTDYDGPSRLVRDVLQQSRRPNVVEEPVVDLRTRLHYDEVNLKAQILESQRPDSFTWRKKFTVSSHYRHYPIGQVR
jgi:hypothetical protein